MGKMGLYYPSGCCQADFFMLFWKNHKRRYCNDHEKRICTVIIVLVIVCTVCVGGFFVWKKTGKGGSKSSQKVYVQKVSSLNTASDFKLSNRSFLGVVEAQESVDVKYDSSKTVAEILVKNGDSVKRVTSFLHMTLRL